MLNRLREPLLRGLHALPLLLPSSCALCGRAGRMALCAACSRHHLANAVPRCACCALPLSAPSSESASGPERCGACLAKPPSFDATIAACDYLPPLDQLVLGLKFGHRLALAPMMAASLRDAALRSSRLPMPDMLAAVPLGGKRLAERGFNQAVEIARPLARHLGVPCLPRLLQRSRDTQAQSLLPHDERRRNVRDAFTLSTGAADMIAGAHVGIVDDVMTTGDTLDEVAAMLKRFGASRVTNYVFARTLPG
ncbi:ComF family protein [Noviherbaspirillum galbum]|uniref:ComF family protein n=1 Tax=Noviherbaspirillum galbum TaxID=2709383 RepID=A0A6B3SYA6_9BURK|nr:phosphoribosyltransferase family protein [Noviherbaspirillum galbum]NEX64306.1 ComF family protein [Noviherbaspirillum galbum]